MQAPYPSSLVTRLASKLAYILTPAGVMIYALVTLGPMAALLAASARWLAEGGGKLEFGSRSMALLGRSLGLALAVALGATVLGVLAAVIVRFGLGRHNRRRMIYASLFCIVLAVVPPYVHATAWMAVVDMLGRVFPALQARGIGLSAWVQMMSVLPIAAGMALLGLGSVESSLVEAARLARRDLPALLGVILPLAAPAILTGAGLCFLLSLTDYSVPSLFQVNVYSLEIFSEFSASGSPERAFWLSLPLLVVCGLASLALLGGLKNTALSAAQRSGYEESSFNWPGWFRSLLGLAGMLWIVQAGVPLLTLLVQAGSWHSFVTSIVEAQSDLAFSLQVALVTGLLCLPLAGALAVLLKRGSRLGWSLVLAPLVLPAPLVGIGLIWIWNQPSGLGVYGTAWMPVLAMLARFSAIAALAILAQHRRTDVHLLEAAQVFQPDPLKRWLGVELPLLAPGLLAAAGIVFVLSAGELGATLITTPPGQSTLTLRIYNYLHYGASETVAGLCLLVVLVTLLVGGVVGLSLGLRREREQAP